MLRAAGTLLVCGAAFAALAVTASRPQTRTLTAADAISALRAVGMTKVAPFGSASETRGEILIVTGGPLAVEQLAVRIFPSEKIGRSYVAKYLPPPPPELIASTFPGLGPGLPARFACNVMVASIDLPTLSGKHVSAAIRRELETYLAKVRAAQAFVLGYLRHRCSD